MCENNRYWQWLFGLQCLPPLAACPELMSKSNVGKILLSFELHLFNASLFLLFGGFLFQNSV